VNQVGFSLRDYIGMHGKQNIKFRQVSTSKQIPCMRIHICRCV